MSRLKLLGLPLDPVTLEEAASRLSAWLLAEPSAPHTVVTLNPEIVVQSRTDADLKAAIGAADLVTADGVGIVWAARQLLNSEVPRAPGFDLASELMRQHGAQLRVFFLGGQPGVAELAAQAARERYGVTVVGAHHGYFKPEEDARIAALVREARPQLLLTGMGAPRQELFNQSWREALAVPVIMGIGGTLDVLAGTAELAPAWTRRLGLEWLWRVGLDRKRWNRAPRLWRFVRLVRREKALGNRA